MDMSTNSNIDDVFNNDFAIIILSYKNPDNCRTLHTLSKTGYTGKYYLIIGTDDPKIEEYKVKHKDHLLIFDKSDYDECIDFMDQGGKRSIGVYARWACYDKAREAGVKYFLALDDDFTAVKYRVQDPVNPSILRSYFVYQLDEIIKATLEYYIENPSIKTLCWSQGGDCIGGSASYKWKQQLLRKSMGAFFCSTDRPVQFFGRMNDDVNAYTYFGAKGDLFLTTMCVMIETVETQTANTGMQDIYRAGTYRKSLYSSMHSPSFMSVAMMGQSGFRLHHLTDWPCAVPCIVSDKYKKKPNKN